MRPALKISALLLICWGAYAADISGPTPAFAACTGTTNVVCSGTTNLTQTIGTGPSTPAGRTVTLNANAVVSIGNANAISLGNNATITLNAGSTVRNTATSGSGLWSAGNDTIEFNSNGLLIIEEGAAVRSLGTQSNAEAVNVIGTGNTIVNRGTIQGLNTAAIWFEDRTIGAANTVDNFGTIQTGSGGANIIGNVIGNQSNGNVNFINRTGGIVFGSLSFANGNDTLTLFPGSTITGGFDGGGGTNVLTLSGEAGSDDELPGDISNFQTLTKTGEGTWTLTGTVAASGGRPLAVEIEQGTLALTGDNADFNGSILVDTLGTLEARAQSLPPVITNNGLVHFAQPDDGTYAGVISGSGAVTKTGAGTLTFTSDAHSYGGGTTVSEGTLQLGNGGTTGDIPGDVVVAAGAAFAIDHSDTYTFDNLISGEGSFVQQGTGTTILTTENTYTGGTAITGGTLQLGNGGTMGSILGDVVMSNDSTLAFNRSDPASDPYVFDGEISGDGSVVQSGSGVTILIGDNSYSGDTVIENGVLFIDGDQSAAMGETVVQGGGRLSGDGIVGGDVTVLDDGVLAPGGVPLTPATLTINGDLELNEESVLFYNVLEANVAGGALNDLTVVNGGLVLDGVINILDEGQTLGPGVYRIIDYDAADGFVNNGLTIGSFVDGDMQPTRELTDLSVQISIPGQVNLINTAGLAFTYWDVAPKGNGAIDGGTGAWRNGGLGLSDNWTNDVGAPNAAWTPNGFAIFAGEAGTVTVDHSPADDPDAGPVLTSGMQFMVDGYTVTGDELTLSNPLEDAATIVVGDGTAAGAEMTATISANLTGEGLIKDGLGTLILDGANSYAGGTTISGGTLQVGADENLGAASGSLSIANNSTLRTTASFATDRSITLGGDADSSSSGIIETEGAGTVFTVNGAVTDDPSGENPGGLVKAGLGTLILTSDANDWGGGTEVAEGTLQIGDGGATGTILGDVEVAADATLAFDQSDTFTFGGVISGEGSLTQAGGTAEAIIYLTNQREGVG